MTAVAVARRLKPSTAVLALACAVLLVLLVAAAIPLSILARSNPVTDFGVAAVLGLPCAAVGSVVAWRRPANRLGWFMIVIGAANLLSEDAGSYAVGDYLLHHGRLPFGPVAVLLQPLWAPGLLLYPLVILLFPDGRSPSPRWRWAIWSYLALASLLPIGIYAETIGIVAGHRIHVLPNGDQAALDHPNPNVHWTHVLLGVGLPLLVAFWVAFLISQARSFRRATGDRRQQLKWLMAGAAVLVLGLIASIVASILIPHPPRIVQVIISTLGLGIIAPQVGMGVGILKYRLYDIDRIISRTLAYAIVTGLLVGVYAGLVTLASLAGGGQSPLAVAIATLVAAALFSPLRRRVQRLVDRRFNRARYDAERTVARYSARLQDAVDLDDVRADLLTTVRQALEPAHAFVWLAGGDGT